MAKQIAKFAPSGSFTTDTVAAVINNFAGRQQMAFFISWATDWSPTSVYLQHAYIHWMTRGLFVGKRKTYLSVQVDDMHVETDIYSPAGNIFRVRPGDLTAHKNWQAGFNSRLPAGSSFFLEIGHNGNGAIIAATDRPQSEGFCNPNTAVDYESPPDTPLEWMKPLGTGTNLWDPQFQNYNWSLSCVQLDPVASWFLTASNRETFAHLSHTFTHLELNNATYYDANKEIVFNKAWMQQMGISGASKFSVSALIPPAITGLHNGDAIKAWWDNGIRNVVGDRTRPVINNPVSLFSLCPRSTFMSPTYAAV